MRRSPRVESRRHAGVYWRGRSGSRVLSSVEKSVRSGDGKRSRAACGVSDIDAAPSFNRAVGASARGVVRTRGYGPGQRLAVGGLLLNIGLAIIKFITGWVGNSYALIADAIESAGDAVSSIVLWGGLRIAARPADQDHPYGHGKAEPLAALLIALLLFGSGLAIGVEAVRSMRGVSASPAVYTLWVLLGVIGVKETAYRVVRRWGKATGSRALVNDAWHHRSDAITSGAAAVGISIALLGGEAWRSADQWAALVAAAIIVLNAFRLAVPPANELMDAVPAGVIRDVRVAAESAAGVLAVEKVLARKSGLEYWVDMHIEVDPGMTVAAAHKLAHSVKDVVRREVPNIQDVLIHVEPAGGSFDSEGGPPGEARERAS